MKKLVLVVVVAMFMFVCGGSFLVKAQNSAAAVTAPAELSAAVNDTVVNDTVTPKEEPAKSALVAPTAFVNDTVVNDTASKDKPAEPVKE